MHIRLLSITKQQTEKIYILFVLGPSRTPVPTIEKYEKAVGEGSPLPKISVIAAHPSIAQKRDLQKPSLVREGGDHGAKRS